MNVYISLLGLLLYIPSIAQKVCVSRGLADTTHLINSPTSVLMYGGQISAYYTGLGTLQYWSINSNSSDSNYYKLTWKNDTLNQPSSNYIHTLNITTPSFTISATENGFAYVIGYNSGATSIYYNYAGNTTLSVGFKVKFASTGFDVNQSIILASLDNPSQVTQLTWVGSSFSLTAPNITNNSGILSDDRNSFLFTDSVGVSQLYVSSYNYSDGGYFQLANTTSYVVQCQQYYIVYGINPLIVLDSQGSFLQQLAAPTNFIKFTCIESPSFVGVTSTSIYYYQKLSNGTFQLSQTLAARYQITSMIGLTPINGFLSGFVIGMQTGNLESYLCSVNVSLTHNCATDNGVSCATCNASYYVSQDGYCVSTQYCQSSNTTNFNCLTCITNYYLTSNLQCSPVLGCNVSSPTTGVCTACNSTLYLTNDSLCTTTAYCQNGTQGSNLCSACQSTFYVDNQGNCANTSNCYNSSNGACSSCVNSFFLNQNLTCCPALSCSSCSLGTSNCTACISGFTLLNNSCCNSTISNCNVCLMNDSQKCSICISGYFINSTYNCQACSTGCVRCANTSTCTQCNTGYYLTNNSLCTTVMGCNISDATGNCISCNSTLYLTVNGSCSNTPYCQNASQSSNLCSICSIGYFLDSSNHCANTSNCLISASGLCSQCANNYFSNQNSICCPTMNCNSCSSGTSNCTACNPGFTLTNTTCCNGSISNCLMCYVNNSQSCAVCMTGYFVNQSYNCLLCTVSGCALCLNTTACQNCNNNLYRTSNYQCSPVSGCSLSNTTTGLCTACNNNLYLTSNYSCSSTPHCQNASQSNNLCLVCVNGFFFDNDQNCINTTNCLSSTNGTCTNCILGYFIDQTDLCQICSTGCLQCVSLQNCQLCDTSFNFQLTPSLVCRCSAGYSLSTKTMSCVKNNGHLSIAYFGQQTYVLVIVQLPFSITYSDVQKTTISTMLNSSRLLSQTIIFEIRTIEVRDGNAVYITFTNPLQDLRNAVIVINFNNPNHPDKYSFNMNFLVSKATYAIFSDYANAVELPILMILMLYLFVQGYKNTYLIIIFQRLSFLRFSLTTQSLNIFNFLYNLRFSYYSLGTNAIKNALPSRYFEYSDGNFYLIDTDANIARNAGIPIIIWLVTIVMRLCGLILVKYRSFTKYSRSYFRCIEFFERTIMFPIIFFAIANMTYCNKYGRIQGSDVNTYNSSIFACVIFVLYFLGFGIWSALNVKIKPQIRYDMIMDYLFALFESIIIVQSIGTNRIMALILIIPFRTSIQLGNLIITRKGFIQICPKFRENFRGFKWQDILKLIVLLFQIIILVCLYSDKLAPSLGLLIILVLLEVVYAFKFLFDKYKGTSKIGNREIKIEENTSTDAINGNINSHPTSAVLIKPF